MGPALSRRLRIFAICWVPLAGAAYVVDLLRQTRLALTNGAGRPLGDDFINYWSGAFLAWRGRAAEVYNLPVFHAFEESVAGANLDYYHYSYPPVLLVLTAPLSILSYVPALAIWLAAGWLCFYLAVRAAWPGPGAALLAIATPAVFINAVGGQNGTWTAALLGGGLALLDRRPILSGVLFGLLTCKPQMGLLLPIALLAGRHFRAFSAAAVTAVALVLASVMLVGTDVWSVYFHNVQILRVMILESVGPGLWHRMVSVFVAARRLGLDVPASYVVQGIFGLTAAGVVALAWYREIPQSAKNLVLVLGIWLATPYVQDYDLVVGAFVAIWFVELYAPNDIPAPASIAVGLILLLPFAAAVLGTATGYEFGPVFIVPAFAIAAHAALTKWPGGIAQSRSLEAGVS